FSSSVKAHPLEIFTVTLIGGTLFGILGMIVAVPTYTLIRIVAKEFFWESKIVRVFTKNI
ncbi:MAG: AI-2E family transporter, partial [Flavobacteriales bacterium]|nr:AI-2E family transporter [Flavobacteriales bacterium]